MLSVLDLTHQSAVPLLIEVRLAAKGSLQFFWQKLAVLAKEDERCGVRNNQLLEKVFQLSASLLMRERAAISTAL